MIFSTPTFLFFFAIVFSIYWFVLPYLLPEHTRLRGRHIFLLLCSYLFYTWSVWQYGLLIAISTLIDYGAGLYIARQHALIDKNPEDARALRMRKLALLISLCMNLGLLAYFKYSDFFIGNVYDFLVRIGATDHNDIARTAWLLRVILPVGISFFTFQSMSYSIDVYRRVIPTERDFLRFALYISFFPQLVAGPIVMAKDFLPQLQYDPPFRLEDMRKGARWFLLGYFKKVVLADNMAPIVDQIYNNPEQFGADGHWLGAFAFWVQVYGDFSGYSDMAWGTAYFLGFRLPENFRMPYLSRSVTEHWQRWHMSLIRWNRDYVYIPLGGSQGGFWKHKFNIFMTMFLAGVWHGANWTFVIWGTIHGSILVLESLYREWQNRRIKYNLNASEYTKHKETLKSHSSGGKYFAGFFPKTLLTFMATSFCTIYIGTMFRADSISESWLIFMRMLGMDFGSYAIISTISPSMIKSVVYASLTVFVGHMLGWWLFEKRKLPKHIPLWLEVILLPILILICIQLGASGQTAFIYFQF